jgi:hypothetical protein
LRSTASAATPSSVDLHKANKYSVRLAYQRARVRAYENNGQLLLCDAGAGVVPARHALTAGKAELIRNNNHDRDCERQRAELEAHIIEWIPAAVPAHLHVLLKANDVSYLHLGKHLIDLEIECREKNRLTINLAKAGFRHRPAAPSARSSP